MTKLNGNVFFSDACYNNICFFSFLYTVLHLAFFFLVSVRWYAHISSRWCSSSAPLGWLHCVSCQRPQAPHWRNVWLRPRWRQIFRHVVWKAAPTKRKCRPDGFYITRKKKFWQDLWKYPTWFSLSQNTSKMISLGSLQTLILSTQTTRKKVREQGKSLTITT